MTTPAWRVCHPVVKLNGISCRPVRSILATSFGGVRVDRTMMVHGQARGSCSSVAGSSRNGQYGHHCVEGAPRRCLKIWREWLAQDRGRDGGVVWSGKGFLMLVRVLLNFLHESPFNRRRQLRPPTPRNMHDSVGRTQRSGSGRRGCALAGSSKGKKEILLIEAVTCVAHHAEEPNNPRWGRRRLGCATGSCLPLGFGIPSVVGVPPGGSSHVMRLLPGSSGR